MDAIAQALTAHGTEIVAALLRDPAEHPLADAQAALPQLAWKTIPQDAMELAALAEQAVETATARVPGPGAAREAAWDCAAVLVLHRWCEQVETDEDRDACEAPFTSRGHSSLWPSTRAHGALLRAYHHTRRLAVAERLAGGIP